MSYKDDVKIDIDRLEHELMNQAALYLQYSEEYATATKHRDKCKEHLDYVMAELNTDCRKNWEDYFDKNPTVDTVNAWIILQKKYRKAQEKLIDANHQVQLSLGVKTALEHKKKALEGLVTLRVTGYYSEPNPKMMKGKKRREKLARQSLNGD